MSRGNDFMYVAEYVKNVLYFAILKQDKQINSTADTHYFSIDNELVYENYYSDFGPLSLGCVYKYCVLLNEKLKSYLNKQVIVHYVSPNPKKSANAAFLMGCYGVLHLGLLPKDALLPLTLNGSITYRPFQDATQGDSMYTITILDCLKALKKARDLGFFNFKDFNFEEYDRWDKITGGDLNWIVPGKFLAFIGPVDYSISLYHPPEIYIDYFLQNDVKIVIRLNKKLYNQNVFSNVGIAHIDLYFADGGCPPQHILFKFLQISEDARCAIAVHCKAGLGRTGSLIGSYLIKHYRMTAREAIAWMRICRPGSVIGHQQGWLEQIEQWLTKQGNAFRKKYYEDVNHIPVHTYGVYSIAEKSVKRKSNTMILKKSNQSPPPPVQWDTRLDILPVPRPRASKVREAVNKTPSASKRGSESCSRTSKDSTQRTFNKGDQRDRSCTKRGNASNSAGEGYSKASSFVSSKTTRKSSSPMNSTNTGFILNDNVSPFTNKTMRNTRTSRPLHPSPPPARPQVTDNKSAYHRHKETKNSGNKPERLNRLTQALNVIPHKSYKIPPVATDNTTAMFSTAASRGSIQSGPRRRLGRSPSPPSPPPPPPTARVLEVSRGTNTPNLTAHNSRKSMTIDHDKSQMSLKKALSKLKCVAVARDRSLGGHSFGAGSLGAPRDAPLPPVARSRVRSDERTFATQGDMLNCIKLQRRLRDRGPFEDKLNTNSPLPRQAGNKSSANEKPSLSKTRSRYNSQWTKANH